MIVDAQLFRVDLVTGSATLLLTLGSTSDI
jgi:hypothetical protein